MPRFGNKVRQVATEQRGSLPLVVSLMVTLVIMAQVIILTGALGSNWLRLKHEATEAAKRAAGLLLQGQDGCSAVSKSPDIRCDFDGVVVQVAIERNIKFWFLENRLRASSRAALNFPSP